GQGAVFVHARSIISRQLPHARPLPCGVTGHVADPRSLPFSALPHRWRGRALTLLNRRIKKLPGGRPVPEFRFNSSTSFTPSFSILFSERVDWPGHSGFPGSRAPKHCQLLFA